MRRALTWAAAAVVAVLAVLTVRRLMFPAMALAAVSVYVGSSTIPGDTFPDASNTGVPPGTSLTAYSGPTTITADDTTIDSKHVTDCLTIDATNVTISNSLLECATSPVYFPDDSGETGLTVVDSELECTAASGGTGISEAHVTATRVEIRDCENGFSLSQDALIEDSWVHDLDNGGGDPHEDGIQLACGHYTGNPGDSACSGAFANYAPGALGITVSGNTLEGVNKDDSLGTSSMIMNPTTNGDIDTNVLITGNLIVGGGTTIYCPRTGSGVNVDITNNTFDVNSQGEDDCADEDDVSGNVEFGTGNPYTLD